MHYSITPLTFVYWTLVCVCARPQVKKYGEFSFKQIYFNVQTRLDVDKKYLCEG